MAIPGNPKGSREVATARRLKAFDLRKEGQSLRDIGAALNISHVQAGRDVAEIMKELIAETQSEAATYRIMATARLDAMLSALWNKATAGNCRAIEVLIKIEERRAKLWGYDAPIKIAPTDPTGLVMYDAASGLSDTERAERITQILKAAAENLAIEAAAALAAADETLPPTTAPLFI